MVDRYLRQRVAVAAVGQEPPARMYGRWGRSALWPVSAPPARGTIQIKDALEPQGPSDLRAHPLPISGTPKRGDPQRPGLAQDLVFDLSPVGAVVG